MWSPQICQVSRHHVCGLNTACREFSSVTDQLSDLQNPTSNNFGPKRSFVVHAVGAGLVAFPENKILFSPVDATIT